MEQEIAVNSESVENVDKPVPVLPTVANDRDFFDEYFAICDLNIACESLQESMQGMPGRGKDTAKRKASLKRKIKRTRCEALIREIRFWESVTNALACGSKFLAEDIAVTYGLNAYEKKLFLLMLHIEFDKQIPASSSVDIITTMDPDASFSVRFARLTYFNEDSALLKSGLVEMVENFNLRTGESARHFRTNKVVRDLISQSLAGKTIIWPQPKELAAKDIDCKCVGLIKESDHALDKVVLKPEVREKLELFLGSFKAKKFEEFGVSTTIKKGTGLAMLFYGPPGTGKSMLADAVASYVGKKLLVVESQKILGRYVGDSEKAIHKMFEAAKKNDLVLLIDEADSLLYNRSSASRSWEVSFVNIMLQEIERFEGVVIFTTNLDAVLDPAVERRIALKIKFELPSEEECDRLWRGHIPPDVTPAADIDFSQLATTYKFSGGNIKNAMLNALRRLGSRNEKVLTMSDLVFGAETEKEGMFTQNERKHIRGFADR